MGCRWIEWQGIEVLMVGWWDLVAGGLDLMVWRLVNSGDDVDLRVGGSYLEI